MAATPPRAWPVLTCRQARTRPGYGMWSRFSKNLLLRGCSPWMPGRSRSATRPCSAPGRCCAITGSPVPGADRIVRTRLHATAQEWIQDSRDPSYLYTGSRLDAAAGAAARIEADPRHAPLSETEKAFLHASRHADRRRVRLRQRFTMALFVLLVGLAAVTVTAVKASQTATSQ